MPRDGSGIYTTPAGTTAVPDTTIESAKYNANVADVAADLNAARPIVAGGTGATSASAARTALGAEAAGIQVTNYDTHLFENGSFWSDGTATARPASAGGMAGWCSRRVGGGNEIVIEAREMIGGKAWVRTNVSGAWSTWLEQSGSVTDMDARYVNVTGDTMTGGLTINGSGGLNINGGGLGVVSTDPTLYLQKAADANVAQMYVQTGSISRWLWRYADASSNNVQLYRCNAAGAVVDVPLAISWATGDATLSGNLTINKDAPVLALNRTATTGPKIIGQNAGATRWTMHLGYGNANADFFIDRHDDAGTASGTPLQISRATGAANFGGSVTGTALISASYMQALGPIISQAAAPAYSLRDAGGTGLLDIFPNSGHIYFRNYAVGSSDLLITTGGQIYLGLGFSGRNGTAGANDGNTHNFRWTGTVLEAWTNATFVGNVTLTCDYRYKENVADLSSTWDAVKALRPITYTAKATPQPPPPADILTREDAPAAKPAPTAAANLEQWGFIAHELQETLTESAATGTKDAPDLVQSPNWMPIVAALTKALQEAMARIEALEAAAAVPAR